MKHLATIQTEFLKEARDWDSLSIEEQKGYIKRHPKTKRKLTAKPESITQEQNTPVQLTTNNSSIIENVGKISYNTSHNDIRKIFKPLFKKHEEYLIEKTSDKYNRLRKKFLETFSNEINSKNISLKTLLSDYPDNENLQNYFKGKDSIDSYMDRRILKEFPIKNSHGYFNFYTEFRESIYDEQEFNVKLKKIIDATIELNESKLVEALYSKLEGLDIKSVEDIDSVIGNQGIEGLYKITLADGTAGKMTTKSIFAGGYNIQILHFRYLIRLDPSLINEKNIDEKPLTDEELKVKNILKETIPDDFDIKTPLPYDIFRKLNELPGASRNLSSFIKKGLIKKIQYGNYYIKRFNYYLTDAGFKFFKDKIE